MLYAPVVPSPSWGELQSLAYMLVRRAGMADADDIVQEALMRCLLAERRGQTVRSPYLRMAVRSAMVDRWRKEGRRQAIMPTCSLEEREEWEEDE